MSCLLLAFLGTLASTGVLPESLQETLIVELGTEQECDVAPPPSESSSSGTQQGSSPASSMPPAQSPGRERDRIYNGF